MAEHRQFDYSQNCLQTDFTVETGENDITHTNVVSVHLVQAGILWQPILTSKVSKHDSAFSQSQLIFALQA